MKRLLVILILLCASVAFAAPPGTVSKGDIVYPISKKTFSARKTGVEITTDTTLTENQCLSTYITNQGASGEVDITLDDLSYRVAVMFIVEEEQVIEINPPSGEAFDLNGTALDANDCVDSDTTVGSKIMAVRMKNASGTWVWSLDSIRGAWVDTGASD